jgi:hexosaminidase
LTAIVQLQTIFHITRAQKSYRFALGMLGCLLGLALSRPPSIIPWPNEITVGEGLWTLSASASIGYDESVSGAKDVANMAAERLRTATGFALPVVASVVSSGIYFGKGAAEGKEEYFLDMTTSLVRITGSARAGLFYGLQTLYQLLPGQALLEKRTDGPWVARIVKVHDKPRFTWRGMMIDVGRHFHPIKTLKTMIIHMSHYKMNVLHWHLTEDQGWRIESKKFPDLTIKGSIRDSSPVKWHRDQSDGIPYGPYFYTQEEIKELVAFAKQYSMTVVPEFEMPGHSVAALTAYPQFSCTGGPFKPRCKWGVETDVFCAGNDGTLKFIEEYVTEFLDLFDSEYVHVGGDECPKDRWKKCPKCQERIKAEKLKDEEALQSWFINHFAEFLDGKGRRLIGWDEILQGGLPAKAAVMSWHGSSGGQAAAKAGHNVVMSPNSVLYFDRAQFPIGDGNEYISNDICGLHHVYLYDPCAGIEEKYWKNVLGVQANLWSEYIWGEEDLQWKAFIRGLSLAEIQWTELKNKDWSRFLSDVALVEYDRLLLQQFNAAPVALGMKAEWESGAIPTRWVSMQWEVTGSLKDAGNYEIAFIYCSGKNGLKVKNVHLTCSGFEAGSDEHEGLAFDPPKDNIWKIHSKVPGVIGPVIIEAEVCGDGGVDTTGRIYIYKA